MIAPTADAIAFALTSIVAACDNDPWGDSGDVLISRAVFEDLVLVHQAAHRMRRIMVNGATQTEYAKAVFFDAVRRNGGNYSAACRELGVDIKTAYRWRQADADGRRRQPPSGLSG